MNGNSTECRTDFETRQCPCRLSVRAAWKNRSEAGCIWWVSDTPGISTQSFAWADSPVRPPAADLGVIAQPESGSHRRMLYAIASRDLQSIGRPDFTGLPEQSHFKMLRLDAIRKATAYYACQRSDPVRLLTPPTRSQRLICFRWLFPCGGNLCDEFIKCFQVSVRQPVVVTSIFDRDKLFWFVGRSEKPFTGGKWNRSIRCPVTLEQWDTNTIDLRVGCWIRLR